MHRRGGVVMGGRLRIETCRIMLDYECPICGNKASQLLLDVPERGGLVCPNDDTDMILSNHVLVEEE